MLTVEQESLWDATWGQIDKPVTLMDAPPVRLLGQDPAAEMRNQILKYGLPGVLLGSLATFFLSAWAIGSATKGGMAWPAGAILGGGSLVLGGASLWLGAELFTKNSPYGMTAFGVGWGR
jgi:hypothetical protein